jgi:hypothetical protein
MGRKRVVYTSGGIGNLSGYIAVDGIADPVYKGGGADMTGHFLHPAI